MSKMCDPEESLAEASVGLLLSREARGVLFGTRRSDSSLSDLVDLLAVACRDEGLGGVAFVSGLT